MAAQNQSANPMAAQGGGVGGYTWNPSAQGTFPAATYAAGDTICQVVFENAFIGQSGALANITMLDTDYYTSALTIYLFNAPPEGGYAPNDAFVLNEDDYGKLLGAFSIAADADGWVGGSTTPGVAVVHTNGLALSSSSPKMLWAVIVAGAGGFTSDAGNSLLMSLGVYQD